MELQVFEAVLAAQDALARLEGAAGAASDSVRAGLLARLSFLEAAGWLAQQGGWVHPVDLALRDAGVTGSIAAASLGIRLPSVLPATLAEAAPEAEPGDRDVAAALDLARRWRRLATARSWAPEGAGGATGLLAAIEALAAGDAPGFLAAAWKWREAGEGRGPGLLFWSAPVGLVGRAMLGGDPAAIARAIAEAGRGGRRLLVRLVAAETRGQAFAATRRSRFPAVIDAAIRRPVVTARLLAEAAGMTPRGVGPAISLLLRENWLREATGRKAWRGYVVV